MITTYINRFLRMDDFYTFSIYAFLPSTVPM